MKPGRILAGAYVALVLGFLMLPVAVVVLASFSTTSFLTVPPQGLTLRWYGRVLESTDYLHAIGISLTLAAAATTGALLIGTATSYALVRRIVPGRALISSLVMSPLVFPGIVIGVALLQFYSALGLAGTFAGLVLAHIVITVPYVVRTTLASLHGLDAELEDAACTLGATRFDAFRLVTLPLLRPGLAAGGLFAFITSFDNVPVSIFLTGVTSTTLPVKLFTAIEFGVDPSVAAISSLMIVTTGLTLVLAERWIGFHRFT
ncbi:ABC transporter permease [Falsiroseomonas sp.]|uniref:ABC transporter permease n=1 Tax=Falsiroseomonas sp. TaxID=2870721 RepID=UPI003561489A